MLNEATLNKLNEMRLDAMIQAYEYQKSNPDSLALSFEERLSMLVESQWLEQENRAYDRKIKNARFKMDASVENIDWKHRRGLEKSLITQLAQSEWIRYNQNCVITGPTGVGKSYLACALGQKACRDGYKVLYFHAPKLFRELLTARAVGNMTKLLKKISRLNLLIVDDWGLETAEQTQYRDFLEIVDECQQKGAILITSQYPVEEWGEIIGDHTVADAILDRLIHNSHKIEMQGESMRKRKSKI